MRGRALMVAALALVLWPAAAPAQQADEGPAESLPVQTVPKIEGARFVLNGRTFRTDANGRVTVPGDGQAGLQDRVEIPETTIAPGKRVQFSRRKEGWYLFNRLVRVRLSFVDLQGRPIAANRVDSVTLKGIHGDRVTLKPGGAHWMQGSRIVPFKEGFREKQLSWVVEEAIVEGQNVVNKNQQRFYPSSTPDFRITLLFYPAHVTVRDSFFGFPTGSRVNIKAPNGKVRHYKLGPNGEARFPSLPRGEYIVTVEGPGLSFEHPLTLSRKQLVDLEFLSYLDLAVGFGVVGSIAIGLLLIGGRFPRPSDVARKARAAARGLRRRPKVPIAEADTQPTHPIATSNGQLARGFPAANALDDEWWSCEFHLDCGHVATILHDGGGAYVAWERDLEKVLGACSIIDELEASRTLVVCSSAVKGSLWAAEVRLLLPTHDVIVLPSAGGERDALLDELREERFSSQPTVLLVDPAEVGDCWSRLGEWDLVVADEPHRMWHPQAVMIQELERLPSTHRLALSASAGEDHAWELSSVVGWLFPDNPYAHDEALVCRAEWRDPDNGDTRLAIGVIPSQLETLRRDPGTFEVYRRKADVPDGPPEADDTPMVEVAVAHRNGTEHRNGAVR